MLRNAHRHSTTSPRNSPLLKHAVPTLALSDGFVPAGTECLELLNTPGFPPCTHNDCFDPVATAITISCRCHVVKCQGVHCPFLLGFDLCPFLGQASILIRILKLCRAHPAVCCLCMNACVLWECVHVWCECMRVVCVRTCVLCECCVCIVSACVLCVCVHVCCVSVVCVL